MKVKDPMIKKALALLLVTAPLLACSTLEFPGVYRLQIEQGNIVTDDMVKQLEPGMSPSQVEFILGTPLIRDSFSPDRWDYLHVVHKPDNTVERERLTVFFENGVLSHYESNIKADARGDAPSNAEEEETVNAEGGGINEEPAPGYANQPGDLE